MIELNFVMFLFSSLLYNKLERIKKLAHILNVDNNFQKHLSEMKFQRDILRIFTLCIVVLKCLLCITTIKVILVSKLIVIFLLTNFLVIMWYYNNWKSLLYKLNQIQNDEIREKLSKLITDY